MKRLLISAIILAGTAISAAAQTRTAYFMEGTTFRNQFNPAFAPTRGYFNIPVLGGINFNVDGTLSLDDILKKQGNGKLVTILSSSISSAEAMKGLNKGLNSFNTDANLNIIGFGAYTKNRKNFWAVDVNLHMQAAIDIPYSLFDFAKNISSGKHNSHDFSDMQFLLNSYADIGFNYSMPVMENLYVGARAKFLVGIAHAQMKINSMNLNFEENEWSGNMQASMNIFMNGLQTGDTMNGMEFGFKGPSGYGFGIDVGAVYDVIENLQVSLAVNDIGFISWGKSAVSRFQTDKQGISFSGVDVVVDENGTTVTNDQSLSFDNFNLHKVGGSQGATTALRATLNAGVEYEMWEHRVGFGLLYHARMGLYKSSHNITASVNFHPIHWFTFTPSYTFNNNSGGAVGLALNLCPSWINFFIATDMLLAKHTREWIPYKQDRMTFTFGLGVPIGHKGYRVAEYAKKWQAKEQNKLDKKTSKKAAKNNRSLNISAN